MAKTTESKLTLPLLADGLAEELGLSKLKSREALKGLFDRIATAVHAGDEVSIFGFGTFSQAVRAPRTGVNPQDPKGPKMAYPGFSSIKFKASKSQRQELKKGGKKK